jgi:hypothetical protein
MFTGMAAVFGRNHGVYAVTAFVALAVYLRFKQRTAVDLKRIAAGAAGVGAGFLPLAVMLIRVSGFAGAYWASIERMFRLKATNLPLPPPWPWRLTIETQPFVDAVAMGSVSLLFVLVPLAYVAAGVYLLFLRPARLADRAPLVGAVFVGAAYLHLMFSRPDTAHLAQAIPPFVVLAFALSTPVDRNAVRWPGAALAAVLVALSIYPALQRNPLGDYLRAAPGDYVRVETGGSHLRLPGTQVVSISAVTGAFRRLAAPGDGILIAPHRPGYYPILSQRSPVWEIYFLAPASETRQRHMIAQLGQQNVNWALVGDLGMDGRDDLRLRHTHPLLWQFLEQNFEPVPVAGLPPMYHLRHRVAAGVAKSSQLE